MALPRPKHHAMLAQSDRLRVAVDRDMPHGQKRIPDPILPPIKPISRSRPAMKAPSRSAFEQSGRSRTECSAVDQHCADINRLISSGSAKITSARSGTGSRATSCRNTGRHHLGMPGRLRRNPQTKPIPHIIPPIMLIISFIMTASCGSGVLRQGCRSLCAQTGTETASVHKQLGPSTGLTPINACPQTLASSSPTIPRNGPR